ncbi:MAG: helix-turn-helix transcriptional regulator [Symploca sp. SIO1C2]|nr:helix-turn-helix transcriptional regulator [Symploca sp. SIO1C2]
MKITQTKEIEAPGLGEKIKTARLATRKPLGELAYKAGMSTANWYRIEAENMKSMSIETLRTIEKVLGVDFGVKFPD